MAINVMPALRLLGSLKAVMPLEMASTPVSAVVPLANACRIRNRPTACIVSVASMGGGPDTTPRLPVNSRKKPTPTVTSISTRKK